MSLKSELMASGMSAAEANKLGLDPLTVFAAAGNSQATATSLTANCANVTSGSGGVIFGNTKDLNVVLNNSGGTITVYPPVGGAINGGTLNAGLTLSNLKTMTVITAGLNFLANVSA